jgi:hypothetical protein
MRLATLIAHSSVFRHMSAHLALAKFLQKVAMATVWLAQSGPATGMDDDDGAEMGLQLR